jgi:hypothetical protein
LIAVRLTAVFLISAEIAVALRLRRDAMIACLLAAARVALVAMTMTIPGAMVTASIRDNATAVERTADHR